MSKHEASISADSVALLHTAVPGPTRLKERRGHKRRNTLRMRLTFLGAEHDATNWSLGGFLVKDTKPTELIEGVRLIARVDLPRSGSARSARYRRDVAASLAALRVRPSRQRPQRKTPADGRRRIWRCTWECRDTPRSYARI